MNRSFNRAALLEQISLDDDQFEDDPQIAFELIRGRLTMRGQTWELPVHPHWSADPFEDHEWRAEYQSLAWLAPLRRRALEGDDDARQAWWWLSSTWLESLTKLEPGEGTPWFEHRPGRRIAELIRGLAIVGPQEWLLDAIDVHISHVTRDLPRQASWSAGEALLVSARALSSPEIGVKAGEMLEYELRELYSRQFGHGVPDVTQVNEVQRRLDRVRTRLQMSGATVRGLKDAEEKLSELHELAMSAESRNRYRIPQRPELGLLGESGWQTFRSDGSNELVEEERSEWRVPRPPGSITYSHSGVNWIDDNGKYYNRGDVDKALVGLREARNLLNPSQESDPYISDFVQVRKEVGDGFLFIVLSTPSRNNQTTRRSILFDIKDGVVFIHDQGGFEPEGSRLTLHLSDGVAARAGGDSVLLASQGRSTFVEFFTDYEERAVASVESLVPPANSALPGPDGHIMTRLKINVPRGSVGTVLSPFRIHRRAAASRILRAMKNAAENDMPISLAAGDLKGLGSLGRAKSNFSVDFQKTNRGNFVAHCDNIGTKYAFYLLRGKEVINKTNYQNDNRAQFANLQPGLYRVKAFAALDSERISTVSEAVRLLGGE